MGLRLSRFETQYRMGFFNGKNEYIGVSAYIYFEGPEKDYDYDNKGNKIVGTGVKEVEALTKWLKKDIVPAMNACLSKDGFVVGDIDCHHPEAPHLVIQHKVPAPLTEADLKLIQQLIKDKLAAMNYPRLAAWNFPLPHAGKMHRATETVESDEGKTHHYNLRKH